MEPHVFLRLQDVVLPPPFPAIVEVLIVAGIAALGWQLARRLRKERMEALDVAAGFVAVTAAVAAVVHGLASAQLSSRAVLRPIGWGLGAVGALALVRHRAGIASALRREVASLWRAAAPERGAALVGGVSVVGPGAAVL